MMYVTLARARAHLNMDHDDDDTLINVYIQAASGAVKNYIKSASVYEVDRDTNDDPILDSNGDPTYVLDSSGDKIVRFEVEAAVLILIGIYSRIGIITATLLSVAGSLLATCRSRLPRCFIHSVIQR